MPRKRISTSYALARILTTLIYISALFTLFNDFLLSASIIGALVLTSVWLFTYLVPAKVEFDSSFMYINEPGIKHQVDLDAIHTIDVAGAFGRQKSYRIKFIYQGKESAVKFNARILLTDFEDFCKAVRVKNPKVHVDLPYPLDNC